MAYLDSLLERWDSEGREPPETGVLSGGEYRALCLAANKERNVTSPLGDLFILDDWLQRLVMERRGWRSFMGSKLG